MLGEKRGKALIRVEQIGFHPGRLARLATQFGHGASQTHPVEQLLLPTLLDRRQGRLPPGGVVASAQCVVQRPVSRDIRIEEISLGASKKRATS